MTPDDDDPGWALREAKKSGTRALVWSATGALVFVWFVASLMMPDSVVTWDRHGLQVWWPMDTTVGLAMNGLLMAIFLSLILSMWFTRPQR